MISRIVSLIKRMILTVTLSPISYARRQGVRLGENCLIGRGVNFGSEPYLVSIGDNFYSSNNIQFITHDGSVNVIRNLYIEHKFADLMGEISVGDNVFLGFGVVVLLGSEIGDNVVVGANSLVKGRLESNGVYAGSPARLICSIDEYLSKNRRNFIYTKNLHAKDKVNAIQRHFGCRMDD